MIQQIQNRKSMIWSVVGILLTAVFFQNCGENLDLSSVTSLDNDQYEAPKILSAPYMTSYVQEGQSLSQFKVTTSGPDVVYEWTKDNTLILGLLSPELPNRPAVKADSGFYFVQAKNKNGMAVHGFTLTVMDANQPTPTPSPTPTPPVGPSPTPAPPPACSVNAGLTSNAAIYTVTCVYNCPYWSSGGLAKTMLPGGNTTATLSGFNADESCAAPSSAYNAAVYGVGCTDAEPLSCQYQLR